MSRDHETKLSEEWQQIFVNTKNQNFVSATMFSLADFRPVFVWKSKKQNKIKLRDAMSQLCGVKSLSVQFSKTDKYHFTLNKTAQTNFGKGVKALDEIKGDSWTDKWDEAIKLHSMRNASSGVSNVNENDSCQLQGTTQSVVSNVNENDLLQLQGTTQSKKRKIPFTNITGTKNYKPNDFSSLIRISKNFETDITAPLREGRGICFNDKGNVCVLDNGVGIQIYEENLKIIDTISFQKHNGVGLSFNQKQYYIPFSSRNIVEIYNENSKWEKIHVKNPISVCVNDSSIYILSRDRFEVHFKSLQGILGPLELFKMEELKLPNVEFSDFIIDGISALLLDSCSGDIYQFDLLDPNLTNKTQLRSTKNEELENRNSSSICHFKDEFFVSESNNWKIRCLDTSFQFMLYYETEPFQPNKITANHQFIFATAFRDNSFQHQSPEQVNSTIDIPDDDQIPYLGFLDKFLSDDLSTTNQKNNHESYKKHTENGELEKMVRFILSSSVLHFQFVNFQKEYVLKIKKVLKQLEKFREVVYLVGETQKKEIRFLQNWNDVFGVLTLLINFKYLYSNYDAHLLMEMEKTNSTNETSEKLNNDKEGSIIFVNDDARFSFQKTKESISFGIICGSENENKFPISIFGNNLVRVFVPKAYQSVDERGMFVIIPNEPNKENIGVGEIISFTDMCTRESSSYYIVGLTTLDLSSNTPSLYLYSLSEEENMKRIHFPIANVQNKDEIILVSMISFPMSDALLDLFIPTLGIETIENTKPGEYPSHSYTNTLEFYFKMHEIINNNPRHVYHLYVLSFN